MHDMIKQSINVLVLFGLFYSPLVEGAPATTSASSSKSASQSSPSLTCGETGWNGSQESFLSTGYCNSWSYCQGVCELHSDCKSFAYFNGATGDTGGDCELYGVPVQGNFVADSSSPYKFYDKSCLTAEKRCNVKGYSRIDSFTSINANSASECATVCSGYNEYSTGCVSYAFGQGTCHLYTYLVVDNVDIDSTSDYIFNDALCGQSAATTTTTATTTKSTAKTTTFQATSSTKAPTTTTTTNKTTTTMKTSSTTKSTTTTTTTTTKAGNTTTTTKTVIPTTTTTTISSTTKSSQTTTTKSVAPTTTSSTAAQCGVLGWGRADPIFDFSVDSLSSCADFCYDFSGGSTNCRSYAYSPAAEECRLYNSTVAVNVWASTDSDYGNYDLACRDAAVASTSTKTTTTTTSLSSKTVTTATTIKATTTTTTTNKSSQSVTTTTTTSVKTSTTKSTTTTTTTTTKTSKSTSTTTTTTTTSPTAQSQCGVRGWGRADAFFDYIGDTLQECAQACFNNRGAPNNCLSYSYGYSGTECRLYSNVSVADNVYVNSGADFGNYDLPCYNASLNIDPTVCTPGYRGAQCNYKLNYDGNDGGSWILNSFDDCVLRCNTITNCRHVVWYRLAVDGVPQNTCQLLGNSNPSTGGVAVNGVDSADRFY